MTEMSREARIAAWSERVKGPYTVLADGRIDCVVEHPVFGDLPFTADLHDVEEHGRLIYQIALERIEQ